jgi:hypothetical protein
MYVFGFAWYRGWDTRDLLQQFHAIFGGSTGETRACHDILMETSRVTSRLGSVKVCFVIMINLIPSVCQWYFTIRSGWFPLYPTALTDTHSMSVLTFWLVFCHFVLLMFLSSTNILHLVGMYIFYAVIQFLYLILQFHVCIYAKYCYVWSDDCSYATFVSNTWKCFPISWMRITFMVSSLVGCSM